MKLAPLLCCLAFIVTGCSPKVWTKEPDAFLGVKLGVPLEASAPPCDARTHTICAQSSGERVEVLNPDYDGLIWVTQFEGRVASVQTTTSMDSKDLTELDLVQRYGQPTFRSGDLLSWNGKKVTLSFSRNGKDQPGLVIATVPALVPNPQPHKNPF